MLLSPDLLRTLLVIGLVGMALLAAIFLIQRRLTLFEYLCWGALIVLLPVLGPFLVILLKPGVSRKQPPL